MAKWWLLDYDISLNFAKCNLVHNGTSVGVEWPKVWLNELVIERRQIRKMMDWVDLFVKILKQFPQWKNIWYVRGCMVGKKAWLDVSKFMSHT